MDERVPIVTLREIPLQLDLGKLRREVRVDEGSPFAPDLERLAQDAEARADPKGIYRLSAVEHTNSECVRIDDVAFTSRVLAVNLEGADRVFPFIATCGRELDAWAKTLDDMMQRFWADAIMEMALRVAIEALGKHVVETYRPGKRAMMNPGSLTDWPICEQAPFFALFGDAADAIGVTLTESCLMSPIKSISGLWFETEKDFQSCQLCPRASCPHRRAPYNPHLFDERYGQ